MRISRSIATLAATLGLALSGCTTGEEPETTPTSASSPAEAPPSPSATTVPAGWKAASVDVAQLHIPADWSLESNGDMMQRMSAPKNEVGLSPGSGGMSVGVYSTNGEVKAALDELAELRGKTLKDDSSLTVLKRLPNETINGSLFYHFRAETEYTWEDHYGTLVPDAGMQVTVVWQFNKSDIDRKGAEALSEPVMATYEVL